MLEQRSVGVQTSRQDKPLSRLVGEVCFGDLADLYGGASILPHSGPLGRSRGDVTLRRWPPEVDNGPPMPAAAPAHLPVSVSASTARKRA